MIDIKDSLIINHLSSKDSYTTSIELSQVLNVSTKTIKRNISSLNNTLKKYDVEIISSRGLGYKICGAKSNIKTVVDIAKEKTSGFIKDDSVESRIRVFVELLINNEYISIDKIAERLNLSIPSINKLIIKVKEHLHRYDLVIKSKPYHGSYIVGEEKDIRLLITDLLISSDKNNKITSNLRNINTKDIQIIEKSILNILNEKRIIISDKDFNILIFKFITSTSRIRDEKFIMYDEQDKVDVVSNEIISQIINDLSDKLNIKFDENEVIYINKYTSNVINESYLNIKEKIEINLQNIITNTLKDIGFVSGVKYENDLELIKSIYEHISRLLNRLSNDIKVENPIMDQIKARFPVEFDLAIHLANKLTESIDIEIDENELGYIAIHFAASNERMKKSFNKKIAIVCHYGIGTGQFLKEKIIQDIPDVDILGVYPVRYLDFVIEQDVDLIVSTLELDIKNKPYVYVENIFSENTISNIKKSMHTSCKSENYLASMFKREAFITIDVKDKYEAISLMGDSLIKNNLIDDVCISKIIDREKVSSTEMTNLVSIPHTIVGENIKSLISVGILKNKILWDKQEVQIIFMVFLNKNETKNAPVFREIYNFIKDEGSMLGIIKNKDYDKFMNMILK